ncbi:MAG: hypothetical protein HY462_00850 [Parcubacteria group bacterium]|nr:hypothetical protein [Parcubacteria group bacterium]
MNNNRLRYTTDLHYFSVGFLAVALLVVIGVAGGMLLWAAPGPEERRWLLLAIFVFGLAFVGLVFVLVGFKQHDRLVREELKRRQEAALAAERERAAREQED